MNQQIGLRIRAFGVLAAVMSFSARADSSVGDEKFKALLGAFLPAFHTDFRLDNAAQEGDDVNLSDDLGLNEDQTGFVVGFEWRIAERHRLGMTYSSFTQTARKTIDREITIGDEVFPVDASIRTEHKIELIPITYSYSFIKSERNELAVTGGIHWDRTTLSLNGSSSLSPDDIDASTSASADLPLPLIGVRYDHHFSEQWSAGVSAAYFSIEFGSSELDAEGSLGSLRAYGEYRFAKRWGAGLAIDAFRIDVDADKPRWNGRYEYDYWGPQIYVTARF